MSTNEGSPILAYYQQIMDGTITAGHWIKEWYGIVVHGLETARWAYDPKRARNVINFIERYCRHHEGPLAPGLITLSLWQKAFLSVVYGIVDSTGRRQFREIVLIIGRKQGKTLLMSGIACDHLYLSGGYGARVYICAPKLDQARLCYDGIYQMISKEPIMAAAAKRRRTDIYIARSNSSAQPLAFSSKKSDGFNVSLGILDEVGAFQGEAGLRTGEVIKSSQGAREEPQLFYTSTANFVSEGLYDEIIKRSTAVINGTSQETRLAPFLYMIDDPEKWDDINELQKSLPNLGISVSVDYILEEIAVARGSLSKKSEFITKYCNLKQNASIAWFRGQDIKKMFDPPGGQWHTLGDLSDTYCVGGIDLSQTTDLTACCVLIEKQGILYAFVHFFMPANRIEELTAEDQVPYAKYIERGFLTPSGDDYVNYRDCFVWFARLIEQYRIYPLCIGYDRYSAQYLVQDMAQYGHHMEPVYQGYNLTGVENDLEGMVKSGKLRSAEDNDLLKLHFLDAAQQIESGLAAHARKKLSKARKRCHVDGVAAILDALCVRANHWNEMGAQLQNIDYDEDPAQEAEEVEKNGNL